VADVVDKLKSYRGIEWAAEMIEHVVHRDGDWFFTILFESEMKWYFKRSSLCFSQSFKIQNVLSISSGAGSGAKA
jgi:hypothetical protein